MTEPAEFTRFLAAMPSTLTASLQSGDECSTAFYMARRQGWSEDELTHDAVARARGGKMGAGWVITGLRNLAKNPPLREVRKPVERWRPEPRELLPQEWLDARNALMRRIRLEKIDPDQAEALMLALVREQRGARGSTRIA